MSERSGSVGYNPESRQPQNLDELKRWAILWEMSQTPSPNVSKFLPGIPLADPPIPGLDRLDAHCQLNLGLRIKISPEDVDRLALHYVSARNSTLIEAYAASFTEIAAALIPEPPPPSAAGRTGTAQAEGGTANRDQGGAGQPERADKTTEGVVAGHDATEDQEAMPPPPHAKSEPTRNIGGRFGRMPHLRARPTAPFTTG